MTTPAKSMNGHTANGGRAITRGALRRVSEYVSIAAPEPEVLRIVGEESVKNGTNRLTSRQIDRIIRIARANRSK